MTAFALTLPLARRNPARIPRRDLSLVTGDGLTLAVHVVATDTPNAAAVDLSGLGPRLRLMVLRGTAVWSVWGDISGVTTGLVEIALPVGTTETWPSTGMFEIQIEYAGQITTLCRGALQMLPSPFVGDDTVDVFNEVYIPIGSDGYQQIGV
jgi:hypothetical protein